MIKDKSLDSFKEKVSKSYEAITTAYHESGHALLALLKNCYVDTVKIHYDSEYLGITIFYSFLKEVDDPELKLFFANAEVAINYAGLISEKIFYKKISGLDKFPSFLKDGSSRDTEVAAKIIKKYNLASSGRSRFLYKKKINKQVINLLQNHWNDIEILSHYLIKNKKIDFNQIKKILIRKSEHREFWKKKFSTIGRLIHQDGRAKPDEVIKAALREQKENV